MFRLATLSVPECSVKTATEGDVDTVCTPLVQGQDPMEQNKQKPNLKLKKTKKVF